MPPYGKISGQNSSDFILFFYWLLAEGLLKPRLRQQYDSLRFPTRSFAAKSCSTCVLHLTDFGFQKQRQGVFAGRFKFVKYGVESGRAMNACQFF